MITQVKARALTSQRRVPARAVIKLSLEEWEWIVDVVARWFANKILNGIYRFIKELRNKPPKPVVLRSAGPLNVNVGFISRPEGKVTPPKGK